MSVIRLSYPGQPVRFVDLGPLPAHVSAQGFYSRGGPLDTNVQRIATPAQRAAAAARIHPPIEVVRCLVVMRTGESCWRRLGHTSDGHASRNVVERDNARRRARDFGE